VILKIVEVVFRVGRSKKLCRSEHCLLERGFLSLYSHVGCSGSRQRTFIIQKSIVSKIHFFRASMYAKTIFCMIANKECLKKSKKSVHSKYYSHFHDRSARFHGSNIHQKRFLVVFVFVCDSSDWIYYKNYSFGRFIGF